VSYRIISRSHALEWLWFSGTLGYERKFATVMLREESIMLSTTVDSEVWRMTRGMDFQKLSSKRKRKKKLQS
jgi:hypothetical protein